MICDYQKECKCSEETCLPDHCSLKMVYDKYYETKQFLTNLETKYQTKTIDDKL